MDGMPAEGTGLPKIGEEIARKYRVESVLGRGGMGAVFAARNILTGKRVAIKWLLPEHAATSTQERLLREARIAASIDHPNVVDIYDVGEHQGGMFLVMEYLRGQPLSDLLAERGRLDPEELIPLIVPAMRGVHAAHQAGVVHRDLKPDNIFLSESDGQIIPKVLDFGVSKAVGAGAVPVTSLTRTGALVGTPHYMALEQVDGSNAIDARTDVYAFGVLVYRALTGHYPFDGTSLGEVILKIGTKDPTPMRQLRPELAPGLDAVVARALTRDRTQRYADLEQLARALAQFDGYRHSYASQYELRSLTPGAVGFPAMRGSEPASGLDLTPDRAVLPRASIGRSKRVRSVTVGAGLALAVLVGGVALMRQRIDAGDAARTRTEALPTATAQAAPAQAVSEPPAPKDDPSADLPTGVALAEPPGALLVVPAPEPLLAPPEEARPVGVLAPDPAAPVDVVPSADGAPVAAPLAEAPVNRGAVDRSPEDEAVVGGKQVRASKATRAGKRAIKRDEAPPVQLEPARPEPQLIPGERTNGLSVDDF